MFSISSFPPWSSSWMWSTVNVSFVPSSSFRRRQKKHLFSSWLWNLNICLGFVLDPLRFLSLFLSLGCHPRNPQLGHCILALCGSFGVSWILSGVPHPFFVVIISPHTAIYSSTSSRSCSAVMKWPFQ